jgi:hypothetical protein
MGRTMKTGKARFGAIMFYIAGMVIGNLRGGWIGVLMLSGTTILMWVGINLILDNLKEVKNSK